MDGQDGVRKNDYIIRILQQYIGEKFKIILIIMNH